MTACWLLAATWPGVLDAHAEQSHRLSDMLGDDHDLAMLSAALVGEGRPASRTPADVDPLLELIAERRGELQTQAQTWPRASTPNGPRPTDGGCRRTGSRLEPRG